MKHNNVLPLNERRRFVQTFSTFLLNYLTSHLEDVKFTLRVQYVTEHAPKEFKYTYREAMKLAVMLMMVSCLIFEERIIHR